MKDAIDILEYKTWAHIDLMSAGSSEMDKRYGFIYVDQDNKENGTLKRSKKILFVCM